jgi:hypothetical protein
LQGVSRTLQSNPTSCLFRYRRGPPELAARGLGRIRSPRRPPGRAAVVVMGGAYGCQRCRHQDRQRRRRRPCIGGDLAPAALRAGDEGRAAAAWFRVAPASDRRLGSCGGLSPHRRRGQASDGPTAATRCCGGGGGGGSLRGSGWCVHGASLPISAQATATSTGTLDATGTMPPTAAAGGAGGGGGSPVLAGRTPSFSDG